MCLKAFKSQPVTLNGFILGHSHTTRVQTCMARAKQAKVPPEKWDYPLNLILLSFRNKRVKGKVVSLRYFLPQAIPPSGRHRQHDHHHRQNRSTVKKARVLFPCETHLLTVVVPAAAQRKSEYIYAF